MIYVKYVYSDPCCMVDVCDVICGLEMCIHSSYIHVKYLTCMVYRCNLVGKFVFSFHLVITFELGAAVWVCFAIYKQKCGAYMPCSMLSA